MANNDALIDAMMQTDRMHRHLIEYYGKQLGMTRSAHYILMLLERGKFPSQNDIAKHLEITPAAVTGIMKKLETAGLIRRTVGTDLRNNEISLTEEGQRFLKEKRKVFRNVDGKLFEGFTPEETEVYLTCLSKMQENMKKLTENVGKDNQ